MNPYMNPFVRTFRRFSTVLLLAFSACGNNSENLEDANIDVTQYRDENPDASPGTDTRAHHNADTGTDTTIDTGSDSTVTVDASTPVASDADAVGDATTDANTTPIASDADAVGDAATDANTENDSGSATDSGIQTRHRAWVVGYYVGYQSSIYPPNQIDFKNLTHIAMGAVLPNPDGTLETHFFLDVVSGPELAAEVATRAHNADVTPILMIGGAGAVSGFRGAASAANRESFVNNLLATMDDLNYDGLDLDWEPIETGDEPLLKALIQQLRAERPNMVLTIPVGWVNANSPTVSSFYSEVSPSLDQINVMSYSMTGAWGGWQVWHSSALKNHGSTTPSSVDSSVAAYLDRGVPASKLGVGAGFFGMCWAGGVTAPGQDISGSWIAAVDAEMSYAMIYNDYYEAQSAKYDVEAEAPYLGFDSPRGPQNCTFISYEDTQSLTAKSAYILQHNLGGIIIWTINQGYLQGQPEGSRNPLLQAITDTLWAGQD